MITPQLITYIRKQLADGVSRDAVQRSLLRSGWTDRDISEAFAQALPSAAPAVAIQPAFALRKFVLSLGLVIVSAAYAAWQSVSVMQHSSVAATPAQSYKAANDALLETLAQIQNAVPSSAPVSAPAGTKPASSPASKPAAQAPAPAKPAGQYADGSYTGTPADAYYGTVQVKAVIQNGQVSDVQFLQYPNDRSNSRFINSQAMPLLTQEAIQVQSANVSGVSGATFTSQAFEQSLASALALAKN